MRQTSMMMKGLFFMILTLVTQAPAHAQTWKSIERDTSSFPTAWEGVWSGTLQIFFPGVAPREVPMRLEVLPLDSLSWSWTLVYQTNDVEDLRPYKLLPRNPEKGQWLIDEQNGIVLNGQVLGPVFVSRFEVGGQLLLARYSLEEGQIRFEILAGGIETQETGGPQEGEGPLEATPIVKGYNVNVYQKALLQRYGD